MFELDWIILWNLFTTFTFANVLWVCSISVVQICELHHGTLTHLFSQHLPESRVNFIKITKEYMNLSKIAEIEHLISARH